MPQTVFVKMPAATAATRMLGELARLAETECRFYRNLAEELGDGVPVSHGSAFDELTGRYVVVLEDMTVSECVFP
ncbi:phosphotransferase, partial [Mycolicibacterium insubricum]|nr:phosphotransferase [Mycolicibacterium insubricum]